MNAMTTSRSALETSPMALGPAQIIATVRADAARAGLDLVAPFPVGLYNRAVDAAWQLPTLGSDSHLGLIIGNTRALWPRFLDALRAEPARLDEPHPLDRYVAETVTAVLSDLPVRVEHRLADEPPPRRVAMQRLADLAGLAWLSPSHLCIHPVFGPWIALRAAVVVEMESPPGPPPSSQPTCADCATRCLPPFERAIAAVGDPIEAHSQVSTHWRRWLASRDTCPIGREHRYDDDQIEYHYTKNRAILRRLVESPSRELR